METSINAELDLLAEAVQASVSLDDTDGRVLGYSVQSRDADPTRVAAILARKVPAEVAEWQRRYGVDEATDPVHLPADLEHGMAARLCVPVRSGGRTVALLWVLESTRELSATELRIAVGAAGRLAQRLAFAEPAARPTPTAGELFRRLSHGGSLAAGEVISGADPELLSVTVSVPAQDCASQWSGSEGALARFAAARRACVAAYVEPDHAALLHVTGQVNAVAGLRHWATGPVVTATASAPVIGQALGRARSAARWASLDPALPRDSTWADVGLHAMASALPTTACGALTPLLEDPSSGAMLLATLETYLDLAGDAQRTASALHLHRTTLYYRLGRAAKVLGLDLADGMTRTRLHLELKQRRIASSPS